MVKNPFKRKKKKKNPFEASLLVDNPDIKLVEARYNEKPFFFGVGASRQREVKGAGGVGTQGIKGEYASQKDLDWRIWYNPNALPNGFMPEERLKGFVASTASVVSGSVDVFGTSTEFIETEEEKLEEAEISMHDRDPNQWLLHDWWKSATRKEPKKQKRKRKTL